MMTFGLATLSNYTNLFSMRSLIRCLKFVHSSRVCPSAPKWCSYFLDGSKLGKRELSLGLVNNDLREIGQNV